MIVNTGNFCQASCPTGSVGIRAAAKILRRLGYRVNVSSMGFQRTSVGTVKLTMIDVRRGENADTLDASKIIRTHVVGSEF